MVQGMSRVWWWCMALWTVGVSATEQPIRAWNLLLDHPNPAVVQLLRLSLDLTVPEYGPYKLVSSPQMEQGRAVKELRSGELVQVGVFAPDGERERELLAIHIPLAKGLLGWRVCLIRQGDEGRFAAIGSLADWHRAGLSIGQHRSWPDTRLLKANGLKVTVGNLYEALFNMLRKKRFDCFLRSVIEIEDELRQYPISPSSPVWCFAIRWRCCFSSRPTIRSWRSASSLACSGRGKQGILTGSSRRDLAAPFGG